MQTNEERSFFSRWWKLLLSFGLIFLIMLAPIGMGFYLKNSFEERLKQFALNNPGYQVQDVEYKRELFHSKAVIELKDKKNTLQVEVNIEHGPFLFIYNPNLTDKPYLGIAKATIKVSPLGKTRKALEKYFNTQSLITGDMVFGFNRMLAMDYKSAVMHYYNRRENFIVTWAGLSGKMTYDFTQSRLTNKINLSRIIFSNQHNVFTIGDSQVSYTAQIAGKNAWTQNMIYSVGNIVAEAHKKAYLNLNDLSLSIQTSLNNNLMNYSDEFKIKKAVIEGENYAPIEVKTAIKKIPYNLYKKLVSSANQEQNKKFDIDIMHFITEGFVLIENGAAFSNSIKANLPSGPLVSDLDLATVTDKNKNSTMGVLKGTLNLNLSRPALQRIMVSVLSNHGKQFQAFKQNNIAPEQRQFLPQQQAAIFINNNIKSGNIINDNNKMILNFTMQGSDVRLNGKPVNTDVLFEK